MRSRIHGSTPVSANAFSPEFLDRFDERFDDEPPTAPEAEVAGLATVRELPDGRFGVFRSGETPERGHRPVVAFGDRSRALIAVAMLPGSGRDPAYRLRKKPDPEGYALLSGLDLDGEPEVAGHMALFDENLLAALAAGDGLARSPAALACLLLAAGKTTLARVGAILERLIAEA
jgi:hypothetical protein